MYPATSEVIDGLAAAGCDAQIRVLDDAAHTAALAAAQLGVDVGAIANSLVFEADGAPLLILTSGGHRVDTGRLERDLGITRIAQASATFVRTHTGQPIGGVAPLGHPAPLRTLVDTELAQHPVIWAAAGHPRTVFATDYRTLIRITGGTAVPVA